VTRQVGIVNAIIGSLSPSGATCRIERHQQMYGPTVKSRGEGDRVDVQQ
jgi:hypothetical protein